MTKATQLLKLLDSLNESKSSSWEIGSDKKSLQRLRQGDGENPSTVHILTKRHETNFQYYTLGNEDDAMRVNLADPRDPDFYKSFVKQFDRLGTDIEAPSKELVDFLFSAPITKDPPPKSFYDTYSGFKVMNVKTKATTDFSYVRGEANYKTENRAFDQLINQTGLSRSDFMIIELIKR